MGVLNWGDLTKNQEDSETIEQAIARVITEHNENEEAHLDTGQSLEAHKTANIIDHPAGSVVADKQSTVEIRYQSNFDSIDSFAKGGEVEAEFNAARAYVGDGATLNSYLKGTAYVSIDVDISQTEWLFQEVVMLEKSTDKYQLAVGHCGGGFSPSSIDQYGVYFYLDGNILSARVNPFAGDLISETIGTVDFTTPKILRIHNNLVSGYIEFYVDGVLQKSIAWPSADWVIGMGIQNHIIADEDIESMAEVSAYFTALFLSYQI